MHEGEGPRRYFSCSTLNGRLYLNHILALDGSVRLSYRTGEDVHKVFDPGSGDRLIHSLEDLEDTLRTSSQRPVPPRLLFLAEGLEEEARRRVDRRALAPEDVDAPGPPIEGADNR